MNLYERRQNNLLLLIDEQANGSRVAFCRTNEIDESRLGQLLSKTYRNGRGFGERAARNLETKLNLPTLFFDREDTRATTREIDARTTETISAQEQQLLRNYRNSTATGRKLIEIACEAASKLQDR